MHNAAYDAVTQAFSFMISVFKHVAGQNSVLSAAHAVVDILSILGGAGPEFTSQFFIFNTMPVAHIA